MVQYRTGPREGEGSREPRKGSEEGGRMFLKFLLAGSNSEDIEDEKAHGQRRPPDRTGGNPQEHVHPSQEDDKGTDRVVDRTQIHEA